jgi:hypothetical protein
MNEVEEMVLRRRLYRRLLLLRPPHRRYGTR